MEESLEYPFHCVEVPLLQKMASCRFCQAIWRECFSSENIRLNQINYNSAEHIATRVNDFVEGLKLAKLIEEILKKDAKRTHAQQIDWIRWNTLLFSFDRFGPEPLVVDIDWCVWQPNGEIDYRQSAIRALNSGRLADGYKFIIMSKFCMEEEMKTISVESLPPQLGQLDFNQYPLLVYWLYYLKNQLDLIPLTLDYTLEKTMASKCYSRHEIFGIEYFWHLLTDDYRITLSKRLHHINKGGCSWTNLQRLFSSISSVSESLEIFAVRYLRLSIWQSTSSQHQLRVWRRFKDQIADSDFADVIDFVLRKAIASENAMLTLLNIWNTANDHHREYVAQNKVNAIIVRFKYVDKRIPPCSLAFDILLRILLLLTEDVRSRLLEQHVGNFVSQLERIESSQKMVDLCLPSTVERLKFKHALSESKELQAMCVSLLQQGMQADLNTRLEWVFSERGPDAVKEYKKIILTLITWKYTACHKTFFGSIPKWTELSQFIDETYAEDVRSAVEMKRMFIDQTIPLTQSQYNQTFMKDFDIMKEIIEMVLPAQDLRRFKCIRLQRLCELLLHQDYWNWERDGDEIFVETFANWCCDYDEESIAEFKKRIPFGALLKRIVHNVMWPRQTLQAAELAALLTRMDRYLKWLVGSDEKVNECKSQAIRYSMVEMNGDNRRILGADEERLRWICGGDQATMQRFR